MKNIPHFKDKGMTIVELLIVLTIVFIVSGYAIMQVETSKKSLTMQNISTEFKTYLERSRFDAVKRRAKESNEMSKVIIKNSRHFSSNTDLNQDGILGINETREINFSHQEDIKFFSDATAFPIVISFNHRGQATAIDGNGTKIISTFLICKNQCGEIATQPENFQIISVSPMGTVTRLNGGELLDTVPAPTNVTTSTSGDINPLVSTMPHDASILEFVNSVLKKL